MRGRRIQLSPSIRTRLREARVARFATLDAECRPHLVPICFLYDGSVFYTAVDKKPKRLAPEKLARVRHISAMPHVAILIDDYYEEWTRFWFVLVRGTAKLIPKSATKERARVIRQLTQSIRNMQRECFPMMRRSSGLPLSGLRSGVSAR